MVGKECKCEIHHRIKIQEAIMITKFTIMLLWKAWTRENKTRTHHDRKMADYVIIERLNTWSQYKKSSWSQHGQIYHNKKSLNTWSQYKTWSSSHTGRLCHYEKHEHVITIQEVTMITTWPIMSLWEVWTRDYNTRIDSHHKLQIMSLWKSLNSSEEISFICDLLSSKDHGDTIWCDCNDKVNTACCAYLCYMCSRLYYVITGAIWWLDLPR
jgi:hypothetical protein